VQFNRSSTEGPSDSLSDVDEQAKETKTQEAARGNSEASEEAEEGKRDDGQCGRAEQRTLLAVFQRELGNPMRPLRVAFASDHHPLSSECFALAYGTSTRAPLDMKEWDYKEAQYDSI
jgi:hypothetical protein